MKSRALLSAALTFLVVSMTGCNVVKVTSGESDPGTLTAAKNLGFDKGEASDGDPKSWDRRGGEPEKYLFSLDAKTKRSGKYSARIRLKPGSSETGLDTSLIQCVDPEPFLGKAFRLNGWIKTEDAQGEGAALWIGAYGLSNRSTVAGGMLPSEGEWRRGSTDWAQYEAHTEPVPYETTKVCFGPILYGAGSAWFDDLEVGTN